MSSGAPNGWFADGMLIFGSLESGCHVAKGFTVETPDLRGASVGVRNEYKRKIRQLLSSLGPTESMQVQWTCGNDYRKALTRYYQDTQQHCRDDYVKAVRNERFSRYWQRMLERKLRREYLIVFLCTRMEKYSGNLKTKSGLRTFYEAQLDSLRIHFQEREHHIQSVLGSDTTVTPMDDVAHYATCKRFLNPSLLENIDYDYARTFDERYTIQENCLHCDIRPADKAALEFDGYYHSVFTVQRWPSETYPGIIHHLTSLPSLDYQITVNLKPLNVKQVIRKEEKEADRLKNEHRHKGRQSDATAIAKKETTIDALAQGYTKPFAVTYIIRTWARDLDTLRAKTAELKQAISQMNGAEIYQNTLFASSRKLFFASWPGWTGSSYTHRDEYAEDGYLADLLPFSATFTGYLEEAEAIYDGNQHNIVGINTFIGGTPQHTVLFGISGAGKSVFMEDLLTQTAHRFAYTVIIEEGLSYQNFTTSLGGTPIIIEPDSDLVINYLDTVGMPLTRQQVSSGVALISRMIGVSDSQERQQVRQAQIGHYIDLLYRDQFESWSKRHREQMPEVRKMACATYLWKQEKIKTKTSFVEAFSLFRELLKAEDDEALEFYDTIPSERIVQFAKHADTSDYVKDTAFAYFKPEDYPVHSQLIELMRFGRSSYHPKAEMDELATLMAAWTGTGSYGKLFDGTTNINLRSQIAHFELGQLGDEAVELRTAAGLLITSFARQHIISLPRKLRKRMIFEEVSRFLDVPGGEKIVSEAYAQLRKFSCWTCSIVQQYERFKSSRIRAVVMGNSKQHLLMRQLDKADIQEIARDTGLPQAVQEAIMDYPLVEQQAEGHKFSSICYYAPGARPPVCGTALNIQAQTYYQSVATAAAQPEVSVS
ncbi:hypothetical protein H5P28_01105 [Ruficoccus amylovorans]|uniref:TraG P-loop domain-containing protein n=1 Tax=Ruficoccus amylovorans TaxID=1804625 RepID=A0A842HB36_9BACT|nr:hypothetical protein [Ruficoccus amylovorans]MBC2592847.1 hypothetical protein [Ruficoccus amylovorans]